MKSQFHRHAVCIACLSGCLLPAQAQTTDIGTVQRAIEDQTLPKRPPPPPSLPAAGLPKPLSKLTELQVEGSVLVDEVKAYWQPWIGRPVSGEQLLAFQVWAADQGRRNGFLVYATTEAIAASSGGERLIVQLVAPRVRSVATQLADEATGELYQSRVKERLASVLRTGEWIDIEALDAHLLSAAYDLPVDLQLILRPTGPEWIDVVVELSPRRARPGEVQVSAWQINAYGLRQYGGPQVLGTVTLAGADSGDEINLVGVGSAGVIYARAEYEAVMPTLRGRVRAWGSTSKAKTVKGGSAATAGDLNEVGLGYSHYLPIAWRHPWKSQYSVSRRLASTELAGSHLGISDIRDSQFRWTLSGDAEPIGSSPFRAEVSVVLGNYSRVEGDPTSKGAYRFLQGSVKHELPLTDDERWQVQSRLRGQWASRNLDSYNRMALGGANGIRAYTTADGVGDSGVQWNVDIVRRISDRQTVGFFYDGGFIRPNQHAVTDAFNSSYTLHAVGVSWSGSFATWLFNSSFAKGFGGYKKADMKEPTESRANESRLFLSATYFF